MKDKFKDQLPTITFKKENVLKIEGKSYYVDPRSVYDKLLKEIEEYKTQEKQLEVIIDLDIFNTPTAKKLLEVFRSLESENAKIVWVYEEDDEDIHTAGQDYESMVKLPFEFRIKKIKE